MNRGTSFNANAFRKKRNRALGVASEIARPLLRLAASAASKGRRTEPPAWRRGLIIGHHHLGDLLYRTCSLPSLKEHLPHCDWTYLTSPGSAPLLRGNAFVAKVLPWCDGENSWELEDGAFAKLRHMDFDVVLCTNTLRHYPDFFLAASLGIPNRVGFVYKGLSGLINHPVPIEFPNPYAAYFRSMVAQLTGAPGEWPLRPMLFLNEADRNEKEAMLRTVPLRQGVPVVACFLTTRQRHGNWPVESLLAILDKARRLTDFEVVLCGTAADFDLRDEYARRLEHRPHVLSQTLSVRGLAAFMASCDAVLTLDSGPRHIANSVNVPVIFARNLAHSKVEAGKYCDTETDIAPDLEYLDDDEIHMQCAKFDTSHAADLLAAAIAS